MNCLNARGWEGEGEPKGVKADFKGEVGSRREGEREEERTPRGVLGKGSTSRVLGGP